MDSYGWRMAVLPVAALLAVIALGASPVGAEMRSDRIDRHLCKTIGGGRFVPIPGFPGERIDRRLLKDILWMRRRFDIFITDGFSLSDVHARLGEHPIGLALDIVPYWSEGGNWKKIGRLAKRAEPRQNRPRPPWRWVGYNGDVGHGRRDHLHLSYMHSDTRPNDPARVVYTRRCPVRPEGRPKPPPERERHRRARPHRTGGTPPAAPPTGGISPKRIGPIAPPVPEVH